MSDEAEVARHVRALADAGVPSPEADVRWLTRHAQEREAEPARAQELLGELVARRASREPLQLVLGETWFRNVRVICEAGVFIPRPETEIVAGLAIDRASRVRDPLVVEACSGTGAITAAMVTEVPGVQVVATEIDDHALALARRNVAEALAGRAGHPVADGAGAEVLAGSLLDPVPTAWRGHLAVLVANPPYLPAADVGTWDVEVAGNDPVAALVGGPHGNEVVDELCRLATTWLAPGGYLVVELDPRLAADAAHMAAEVGLVQVQVLPDLTGRERALVARRADLDVG